MPHTPEPWLLDGEDQYAKVIAPDTGYTIAETEHIHAGDLDDAMEIHLSNMRLIAKAPALLRVCKEMHHILTHATIGIVEKVDFVKTVADAMKVIAEAEGNS